MKDLAVDIMWLAVAVMWVSLATLVVVACVRSLRDPRQRKGK